MERVEWSVSREEVVIDKVLPALEGMVHLVHLMEAGAGVGADLCEVPCVWLGGEHLMIMMCSRHTVDAQCIPANGWRRGSPKWEALPAS